MDKGEEVKERLEKLGKEMIELSAEMDAIGKVNAVALAKELVGWAQTVRIWIDFVKL